MGKTMPRNAALGQQQDNIQDIPLSPVSTSPGCCVEFGLDPGSSSHAHSSMRSNERVTANDSAVIWGMFNAMYIQD